MFLNWFPTIPYSHLKQHFSKKSVKKWGKKVVYGAFVKDHLQLFLHFLHLFSFPRVIWTWFFNWCIALTLGNVFHTQNMFLNWFPTILRPFEAKVFDEKCQKVTFGQTQKWVLGHFLRILFNFFVYFLQYFHFYASYDPNFFTDVLPWPRGMFFISRTCF